MTAKNFTLTDPAREIAELCEKLCVSSDERGEDFLARHFGVEVWSREFYQIVFTIIERCDLLKNIVRNLDMDDDFKQDIVGHVDYIETAFSAHSMRSSWKTAGFVAVGPLHIGPLKAISPTVRVNVGYRRLSDEEYKEIITQVENLIIWLNEH